MRYSAPWNGAFEHKHVYNITYIEDYFLESKVLFSKSINLIS